MNKTDWVTLSGALGSALLTVVLTAIFAAWKSLKNELSSVKGATQEIQITQKAKIEVASIRHESLTASITEIKTDLAEHVAEDKHNFEKLTASVAARR